MKHCLFNDLIDMILHFLRKFTVPRVLQQMNRSNKRKDGTEEYDDDEEEEDEEEEEGGEKEGNEGSEKTGNQGDGKGRSGGQAYKVYFLFLFLGILYRLCFSH